MYAARGAFVDPRQCLALQLPTALVDALLKRRWRGVTVWGRSFDRS
jgi:hypothetical protein